MSMLPRDEPARIDARHDHDAHRAVEAGAGTGKTTLLVDRIIHGLGGGAFTMPGLVAITFTRKAAGELRERLRRELSLAVHAEAVERGGDDGATREPTLLERAQRELPQARVSTIHAFCSRLLRQHPLEAGLDPDFTVSAETRQQQLFDDAWARWLHARAPSPGDPLADALAWGASVENIQSVARALVEDADVLPPASIEPPPDEEIWSAFADGASRLRDRLAANLKPGKSDKLADALDELVRAIEAIERRPAEERVRYVERRIRKRGSGDRQRLAFVPDGLRSAGAKTSYADVAAFEATRDDFEAWSAGTMVELLRARQGAIASRALAELAAFRDAARAERLASGVLSQSDLLYEAHRLLASRSNGVLDRLCRRTGAFLVDEYQDTDPIQAAIVELVRSHDEAPVLFLVGDPKQSIYRFRRADVETYLEQVSRLDDAGRLGRIYVNFRSRAPLIEAINRVGRECFDDGGSGVQADWQDLESYPETGEGCPGASVEVVPLAFGDEKPNADENARAQAVAIAARLAAAREDGYEWSEMAVLFAAGSRQSMLEDALDGAGIHYRQEKSQDFYRRVEVAEISWLATAVADPWDESACVAVLRSRLFGIDDATLLAHRTRGGRFSAASHGDGGDATVREALARIDAWHRLSLTEPPSVLLESAIRERGLLLLLAGLPHGAREAANVRKLLDQASAWWRDGGLDMAHFARWLRAQVSGPGAREPESPSAEEENRVSLLTIHAAKGLEWKLVALYDVHGGTGGAGAKPSVHDRDAEGERRIAVRFSDLMQTPRYADARTRDETLEDAERVRLLYVAITRARERLVIPAPDVKTGKRERGSMLGVLRRSKTWCAWEAAARGGGEPDLPGVRFPADVTPPVAESRRTPRRKSGDAGRGAARRAAWRDDRDAVVRTADGIVVTVPSALHDPEVRIASGAAHDAGGRAIGSAVHVALEELAGRRATEPDEVRDATLRALAQTEATAGAALSRRVHELVERAVASDLWVRVLRAERVLPELPIAWRTRLGELPERARELLVRTLEDAGRHPGSPSTSVTIEGFADLVLEEDGVLTVVDYKTDTFDDERDGEALARRYAPQLAIYREALRSGLSRDDVRAEILALGGPRGATTIPVA